MVICPKCKQSDVEGSLRCSRCGAAASTSSAGGLPVATGLVAGSAAGGGGIDEYQQLMAKRAAQQKRNRTIFIAVALLAVGGAGTVMWMNNKKAKVAQEILDQGGRFAERDKTEMGSFWNCVTSSEVDVGNFKGLDEIQMRIESAYFTQQKTFSEHLTGECVPKIERARSAMGGLAADVPEAVKPALDKYLTTLPRLQAGLESYAEKVKGRGATKDVDATIQEVGGAFSPDPTAESVAFEKFLVCAIPDLAAKKDIQAVLEFMATTCKADAVKFMTGVREKCGPLIQNVDKEGKATPSKTFKANAKKLYEEDPRQLQAWEYCAKRSRKGKKTLDLEEFLTAAGDHIEARFEVAQGFRETAARVRGEPIEAPKKKEGEPGAVTPPSAAAPAAPPAATH